MSSFGKVQSLAVNVRFDLLEFSIYGTRVFPNAKSDPSIQSCGQRTESTNNHLGVYSV
jgi:hypothetical protein